MVLDTKRRYNKAKRKHTIYSVYSGDKFVAVGTAEECAKAIGIKVTAFWGKLAPTNQPKTEKGSWYQVYKVGYEQEMEAVWTT